jgi:hypothetical protein
VSESGCRKREQQSALEVLWALGALEPKKRLKRPDADWGCGGKGAENSPQRRRFLPLFHRYRDFSRLKNRGVWNSATTAPNARVANQSESSLRGVNDRPNALRHSTS